MYVCGSGEYTELNGKRCVHFVNTSDSRRLYNEFLKHIVGINDNSFIRGLDPDIDEDNELNCPHIISHSSYYDSVNHCTLVIFIGLQKKI